MRPTSTRIHRLLLRGTLATAIGVVTAGAGSLVAAGATAPAAGAAAAVRTAVVPVPGDWYAPPGTGITFRGATPATLRGLSVAGSVSGAHLGTISTYPGDVAVFTPARPFAGGERVTVEAPGLDVTGVPGAPYVFGTDRPASPAAAAAALRVADSYDSKAQPATGGGARSAAAAARARYTPPTCTNPVYHSEPTLNAQSLCENVGVTTSGTEPGTFLFLTPGLAGGTGAGIYQDNGSLVWWMPGIGQTLLDESVVDIAGVPYMAIWGGAATSFGKGVVTLYNEHYQVAGVVTAGPGFAPDDVDLHEFQVTPSGDALIGIYEPVDVTYKGALQTVLQYVVEEVQLVQTPTGIGTGPLLFEWSSLTDVPVTQSELPSPPTGQWDYFHGNAIALDTNGDLVVSSRHTWGIYELDTNKADPTFGHVLWQVGAPLAGDNQLSPEPWCYQHNVTALGNHEYSIYDDGGDGPNCVPGLSDHPARGLVVTITPPSSGTDATVALDAAYTHNPAIYTGFTGSTQVLSTGNVLVDWANVPEITEYSPSGSVLMDLTMSSASYRGFRYPWVGEPLTPPSVSATTAGGKTTVYASWNGATQVSGWQILAGDNPSHLVPVGAPPEKTGFETAMTIPGTYSYVAVEGLTPSRTVLGTSPVAATAGYVVATSTGSVTGYGDAQGVASAPTGSAVGLAETPAGGGYWIVDAAGGVASFGDATFHGSAVHLHLNRPIVGMAPSADGGGYWLVASDGGIFTFGDARFHGSAGSYRLNRPIFGMAATPDGGGYWLVASDGGIFSFGDARFHGSAGGSHLRSPVVAMTPTIDGGGYWLFVANGQVLAYGDAHDYGSASASALGGGTVVAAGPSRDHQGYWLLSSTGHVVGFGDAPSYGPATAGGVGIAAA